MINVLAIEKTKSVLFACLLIVFGVLFIALPQDSFIILTKVFSWILVGLGALLILHFLINIKFVPPTSLVTGMLLLLFGILLLLFPGIYIILIAAGFAVIGISYISISFEEKKAGLKTWWQNLLYGIVELVFGIILMILSYAAIDALMIFLGISFIVDGVFVFVMMFAIKHEVKQIKKQIQGK